MSEHWKQRPAPGDETQALTRFYEGLIPVLRTAARLHGYALMVHGSMVRDLDMLAVPWTPEAISAESLVLVLAEAVERELGPAPRIERALPLLKPHGRLCWTIRFGGQWSAAYIDLGVMPRLGAA